MRFRGAAMIFGWAVTVEAMMIVGVILFAMVLFEVLLGLRVIKLGRKQILVHKWTGLSILAVAAIHGVLGMVYGLSLVIFS